MEATFNKRITYEFIIKIHGTKPNVILSDEQKEELQSTIISAVLSNNRYEKIKEVKYLSAKLVVFTDFHARVIFDSEVEAFEERVENIVFNLKAIEEHISTHLNIYPLFYNISDKSHSYYPTKTHVQLNRLFNH